MIKKLRKSFKMIFYKTIVGLFVAFYLVFAGTTPSNAEGNPFILTTDTMQTGLIPLIGGKSLYAASQSLANFTDITGAYYDSNLDRIVFIGTTTDSGLKFNKDDIAVAIRSVFFNNTIPDVNIGDDPANPSSSSAVVSYSGGIQNTNLGSVLFNSDYKLKQYVIGYDPNNVKITSNVQSYKSVVDRYLELDSTPTSGNQTKFILSPKASTLKNSASANAFVFLDISMQATLQHTNQSNEAMWNQAASDFTNDITNNYDQYASETTSLAQAKQIAKIIAILKWISDQSVPTDLHWAHNYSPDNTSTPTTVQKVKSPISPNGYSAQGQIIYNTPNTYITDDGIAASLKNSAQAASSNNQDVTWTFTNGGQQYQAVAVSADAFKSLGGYSTSAIDFGIPIAGDLTLAFSRTYSSFSNAQFGLGIGWDYMPARLYPNSTLQDLDIELCNNVLFFKKLAIDTANGHETFTLNCPGGYSPDDPSFHSKLTQNADESFTITSSDQTKNNFNPDLELTSVQDKNGNKINYSYDSNRKLTSITDTKNHQLTIVYNEQNLISSVTDWVNQKVQYNYTDSKLTSVIDPNGNTTTYGYDGNSRLTTITDRTGAVILTNTYNPDGRIATQKNAAGLTKINSFDNNAKLITQTDSNGRVVKTNHDDKSRILQQTDPLQKSMTYTYGAEAVPLTQTDKNSNKMTFTYDPSGNVTSVLFPDNKSLTNTYNTSNRITKILDNRYGASPKQTDYSYDSSGNQTQRSEAGTVIKLTYDTTGEVLTSTDPLNRLTTFTRDSLGNPLTEKDSLNNTSSYEYDALGRLLKITDADSKQFLQTFDANGNVLTLVNTTGTTTNVYDKENRLQKITLPNNTINQYAYNSSSSMTSVTDALGNSTSYGYDIYQNLLTQTDALNKVTTHSYDQLNRYTQEKTPMGNTFKYEYDANGNVTKRTDALNRTTNYQYDAFNRLTKTTYPDAKIVTNEYDNRGNKTKMIDPQGTSTYIYDIFDRLTQYTNPYNKIIKYEYDKADNLTKLTYPDNKAVLYTYDSNNRMLSVKDWNSKITSYTYNKNGTMATRVYPNTISTKYTYDSANRLMDIEHKKGTSVAMKLAYERDAVGNITKSTPTGSFMSIPHPTFYTYDALGRIVTQLSEDREGDKSYIYDKVGNILSKTADRSTTTYAYDNDYRLTSYTDPTFGSYAQAHDSNGNLTTRRVLLSNFKNLTYDFDNRLLTFGQDATFKYDGDGNRLEYAQTWTRRFVNDASGSLSRVLAETSQSNVINNWFVYGVDLISEGKAGTSYRKYYIEDALGSSKALTGNTGSGNRQAYYDPFGNVQWGDENKYGFAGQEFDETTDLQYMRARYYDPYFQRFITRDPVVGELTTPQSQHPYQYAYNNPVNLSDPSGENPGIILKELFVRYGQPLAQRAGNYLRSVQPIKASRGNLQNWTQKNFNSPRNKPGAGWEWRGPKDKGSWYNPKTKESLRPDLKHGPPQGSHWDYVDPKGKEWRIDSSGNMTPK